MSKEARKRLFTVPPGVPFLETLSEKLLTGSLIPGFAYDPDNPLNLASATIYVPTRRAARALRSVISDQIGSGSAILPVIRPLGETDDDLGFFDLEGPGGLDLAPPLSPVAARLRLADLVKEWRARLPLAMAEASATASTPADAIWLGSALFDLIQSIETEEGDLARLDHLVSEDFQAWWQITLTFLKIVRDYWPNLLAELSRSSPGEHQNSRLDALTETYRKSPPEGPVIVAGSTGSRPATARLIEAVTALPNGAVVLPGLDMVMNRGHWQLLERLSGAADLMPDDEKSAIVTIRSHPQYGLFRLASLLGFRPEDPESVEEYPIVDPALAARRKLVSAAMLPARATEAWRHADILPDPAGIEEALSGITLIEAANEREEAAALALAMRAALEPKHDNSEPVAALVTPDRALARRVIAELRRYGIDADDSGGRPLAATPQGTLARLALSTALDPGDPAVLAALVKHPLMRCGLDAKIARRAAHALEMIVLRGPPAELSIANLATLVRGRAGRRHDRHAPASFSRLGDDDVGLAMDLAQRLMNASQPLLEASKGALSIGEMATHTAAVLENLCRSEEAALDHLWGTEAGEALATLLLETRDSGASLAVAGAEWIGAFDALTAGSMIKPRSGGHPRAHIWGVLEARLQHVDTILIGGLNEKTFPSASAEDPFLSRSMKAAIGLEPPERRAGQAAHDFVMALGVSKVVLSRSLRAGNAPSVASRWLQRLLAVTGDMAKPMSARGLDLLNAVKAADHHLDSGEILVSARPAPCPPSDVQPRSYTFSEVKTLRRDPYAIYAKRILGLDPIDQLLGPPGVRERGTLFHAILERALKETGAPLTLDALNAAADLEFAAAGLSPDIERSWRARFGKAAEALVAKEAELVPLPAQSLSELRGKWTLEDGLVLSGKADRIDLLPGGGARLIDYKTGTSPSATVARKLIDPQLALESHVLEKGGFADLGPQTVEELLYLRLTGGDSIANRVDIPPGKKDSDGNSPTELGEKAVRELTGLVADLASGKRPFLSRVLPESARMVSGDYDHLARVAEWQTAVDDEGGADE